MTIPILYHFSFCFFIFEKGIFLLPYRICGTLSLYDFYCSNLLLSYSCAGTGYFRLSPYHIFVRCIRDTLPFVSYVPLFPYSALTL